MSHATHDKWVATILCEKMEEAGATVFRDDRDIEGGDSIPQSIIEGVQNCDELVVLLTPASVQRQWVLIEIGMAIGVERRIVPLLHHVPPESMPDIIRDRKGYELNDLAGYLTELATRVQS